MRSFVATVLVGSVLAVLAPTAGRCADVVYSVTIDGRNLDARHRSALNHDGVTYINVVRAVQAFDGLLTFGKGGSLRVTVHGRTLRYRLGNRQAQLDNGATVKLPGTPFAFNGDTYVPVASIANLAGFRYSVDTRNRMVRLALGLGAVEPGAAATPELGEDLADLSPLQALTIKPSAAADATGLHARADITNISGKPYVLTFPGPDQFVLVVARNGTEIWTSQSAGPPGPSTFRLQTGETTTVSQDWPGFLKAAPGRYTLRVRLRRALPIDTAPVSLDVVAPGLAPSAPP